MKKKDRRRMQGKVNIYGNVLSIADLILYPYIEVVLLDMPSRPYLEFKVY